MTTAATIIRDRLAELDWRPIDLYNALAAAGAPTARNTVFRICRGEHSNIGADTFLAMAEVLAISVRPMKRRPRRPAA